ncbi:MAG: hypothetical protein ACOC0O_05720 [Spirochaetota bacterium]
MSETSTVRTDPMPLPKRILHGFGFIVIAAVSLGMPLVPWPVAAKLGVAAGLGLAATYLAFADRPVFVPALFFVINAAMSPFVFMVFERMAFQVPNTSFLPPIAVYLAAVLSVPSLRDEIRWLRPGAFNRSTVILTVVLVVGSAIALVFWALVIADDLEQFRRFVPSVPVGLLIAYGAGFAATNSFFEEFMARAVLYDGFSALGGTRFAPRCPLLLRRSDRARLLAHRRDFISSTRIRYGSGFPARSAFSVSPSSVSCRDAC